MISKLQSLIAKIFRLEAYMGLITCSRVNLNIFFILIVLLIRAKDIEAQIDDQTQIEATFTPPQVSLYSPSYFNGTVSTDFGGIITAKELRIQASNIFYNPQGLPDSAFEIEASKDLIFDLNREVLVADHLIYSLKSNYGQASNICFKFGPWFVKGQRLIMQTKPKYTIWGGSITTSESANPRWKLSTKKITIDGNILTATDIKICFLNSYFTLMPRLVLDLDSIFSSPIRCRFKWGGKQGPRFGISYQVYSSKVWQALLRLDYRLTRGPGAGFELSYQSIDKKTNFQSINYVSKDSSLIHLHEKLRYRFKGILNTSFEDNTYLLLSYDKLSDIDMPQSYDDKDFQFESSEKTQLFIKHQHENIKSSLYFRLRVNSFQTVKEELPTLFVTAKPIKLESYGAIFENFARLSYLDYKYSDNYYEIDDYSSSRFEYSAQVYRPFNFYPINITPEFGSKLLCYGNTPDKTAQISVVGIFKLYANTQIYKAYQEKKHIVQPYLEYLHYQMPRSDIDNRYIFDINDGILSLNQLKLGISNQVYTNQKCLARQRLNLDIFANIFFNQHHKLPFLPKIYASCTYLPTANIRHKLDIAWDFIHGQLDHLNLSQEFTVSSKFAIAFEYRHRSPWSWRKVDQESFFLEAYRTNKELYQSSVSDKRNTFLAHFYYKIEPNLSCEFISRSGWNRSSEPSYFEYELNFYTKIESAWNLQLSLQHQETENRVALYLNLKLDKPATELQNFVLFN